MECCKYEKNDEEEIYLTIKYPESEGNTFIEFSEINGDLRIYYAKILRKQDNGMGRNGTITDNIFSWSDYESTANHKDGLVLNRTYRYKVLKKQTKCSKLVTKETDASNIAIKKYSSSLIAKLSYDKYSAYYFSKVLYKRPDVNLSPDIFPENVLKVVSAAYQRKHYTMILFDTDNFIKFIYFEESKQVEICLNYYFLYKRNIVNGVFQLVDDVEEKVVMIETKAKEIIFTINENNEKLIISIDYFRLHD